VRIVIDVDRCQSNGLCVGIAPGVFELGDDFTLRVAEPVGDDRRAEVEDAARMCPTQAIRIEP
jgi:ferredoxin